MIPDIPVRCERKLTAGPVEEEASMSRKGLSGTIHEIPFQGGSLVPYLVDLYERLQENYDTKDILVLKRLPTGITDLTQSLGDELDLIGVPNVQSIAFHARNLLARETTLDIISYEERIEFLALVIDQHDWDHEYFERPSELDSFGRDVGQILMDATWQGGFEIDGTGEYDDFLTELASINERFHNRLDERGQTERARVLQNALETIEDPDVLAEAQREYDAIIVAEFEEFNSIERTYLSYLAESAELVCLAESDSSIERVWSEPGESTAESSGLESPTEPLATERDLNQAHSKIAEHLATGKEIATDDESLADDTYLIQELTFEEQLQTVANEIEYLRHKHDLRYDEIGVLLKDANAPIPEARHVLQHSGIPVASATVLGLDQDPSVRELHGLATYIHEQSDTAQTLLTTRLDIEPDTLDAIVEDVRSNQSLVGQLEAWIRLTQLKDRIAKTEEEAKAKNQFSHVEMLLEVAEFVDDADYLDATWPRFNSILERTVTDYQTSSHSDDLDVEEGGVLVDTVNVLKNDQRKAVFLLNVVEGEYPEGLALTPLFPTAWLRKMTGFPNVTDVSPETVTDTFRPAEMEAVSPLNEYYRQLDRRKLAIGARSAQDHLYFCTYEADSDTLDRTYQPSRYLRQITDTLQIPQIGEGEYERDVYTTGNVSRIILKQPWEQLEAVRAAASIGDQDVALEDAEQLFGAIQSLIESAEIDPRFSDAVYRQIEMARGEVGDQ
ncbi:hypothetical protein [Halorubrum ezzemoulense]|uniref:hypothetical protein n=1 Tax=Halorubrum ezzemoulense TaxID=337243 RepID=UPI0023309143|nr:hypothetical protein [Halorubrum ezzemoulense]MDB9235447.1 hypothetical protein [Halorubrum ezzemoulense]